MEGDVSAVRAVELGADMNGSWIRRSWGETVPMLVVELETLPLKSYTLGSAGDENAVVAPPSKAVNSSMSSSDDGCERRGLACGKTCRAGRWLPCMFILARWMLPVVCENRGTGGRAGRFCCCRFKATVEDGADEA